MNLYRSTMATTRVNLFLYAICLSAAAATPVRQACNETQCPGPLKFYEELSCTPIYKNPGDCCAEKYECDYLKHTSSDKCYYNGHEYSVDESLRKEDERCYMSCRCIKTAQGDAAILCAAVDYFFRTEPGCYRQQNATDCYPGPQICPKSPEERAKCEVDGKVFLDGEIFWPESEPRKMCYCGPGYTGQNIEPFCKSPPKHHSTCGFSLLHNADVQRKCAPIYEQSKSPQTDCNEFFRCQNDEDKIIKMKDNENIDQSLVCHYGNLTMNVGDELNTPAKVGFAKFCTKCVCEVPPMPTCQRLSDNLC